jgi:hypothetical protein
MTGKPEADRIGQHFVRLSVLVRGLFHGLCGLIADDKGHYDAEEYRTGDAVDKSAQARPFLSHLDDDLSFCTSFFDVGQSLPGRFEWKNPIHNWAYDPGIDERSDPA